MLTFSEMTILRRLALPILILSAVALTGCLTPGQAMDVQETLDDPALMANAQILDTFLGAAGMPPITGQVLGFVGLIWSAIFGTRKIKQGLQKVKDSPEGKFTA